MIVGVDLSLRATGLCVDGECSTLKIKQTGMDRLHSIRQEVLEACDGAELVVIEGYSYNSGQGAHQIGELGGIVRYALWDCSIPYAEVPPATLKMFATGKGNANKDVMVAAAARLGCPADDNNAVDAWWLWQMGCYAERNLDVCSLPRTAYRDRAMDRVTTP